MGIKIGTIIKFNDQKHRVYYVEDNYALVKRVGSTEEDREVYVVEFGNKKLSLVKDKEIIERISNNILQKFLNR
jgi:hypothetical protein